MSRHRVRFADMEDTESPSDSRSGSPSPLRGALHLTGLAEALPPLSATAPTASSPERARSVRFASGGNTEGLPSPSIASSSSSFGEPPSPPPKGQKDRTFGEPDIDGLASTGASPVALVLDPSLASTHLLWDMIHRFGLHESAGRRPATKPAVTALLLRVEGLSPDIADIHVRPKPDGAGVVEVRDVFSRIYWELRCFVSDVQLASLEAAARTQVDAACRKRVAEEHEDHEGGKRGVRRIDVLRKKTVFAGLYPLEDVDVPSTGSSEPVFILRTRNVTDGVALHYTPSR